MTTVNHKDDEKSELFKMAKKFLDLKWHVFPLVARTKKPATAHGFKDASMDATQIEKWFGGGIEKNIGVVTGVVSGIGVIDVDPKNGGLESFKKLLDDHKLDTDTLTVETGSGGFHLYYSTNVKVKSRNGILPGIDIKGDGGYVVAPPSIHPNGKPYIFNHDFNLSGLKPFPFELLERLESKERGVNQSDKIAEGGRHNFLVSRMGRLQGLGFNESEMVGMIHSENENKCEPQLEEREMKSIISSFQNRPLHKILFFAQYTELGNAERFKAMFKNDVIFVTKFEKWFIYDGKRYAEDSSKKIVQMAKFLLRSCKDLAGEITDDDGAKAKFSQHLKNSESYSRIMSMLNLAKTELPVNPDELDKDTFFLNVLNGTINLQTGVLLPHDSKDLLSKVVNISFDKNAQCPNFEKFLKEITCEDDLLQKYLQKIVGYCLTGETSEQSFWILHGLGSNGKTTFIEIMKRVFGEYGRSADISTFSYKKSEQIRNDIARLFDARVVTSVEIQEGKLIDESIIKQVTGGDPVTSRFLFSEYFEYTPKWKLFMVVNHLPHINGTDRGIWRRIKVIPFKASFEAGKKDKNLLSKLSSEMPGILNWAIQGCLNWQEEGLIEPPSVIAAGEAYKLDEDSLGDFLNENTEDGVNFQVSASELYKLFSEYHRETGQWVMSQKLFSQKLFIKGYKKKRGDKGRVVYLGLRVKGHSSGIC